MRILLTLLLQASCLLVLTSSTLAQTGGKVGTLFLSGKIVNESKRGLEANVQIYRGKTLVKEFLTSKIGKFTFDMPLQDSIALVVSAEGYVSKTIIISTKVHQGRQSSDYNFPFFIDLYPVGNVPSNVDLDRPVGRITYFGGQFIYDTEFTKRQNALLREHVQERKNLKVRELK